MCIRDSFVGEDGPTHQPVEHTMSLRNIPNLLVFRPSDSFETFCCFKTIMKHTKSPSAILLTRQKLPILDFDQEKIELKTSEVDDVEDLPGNPGRPGDAVSKMAKNATDLG